MTVSFDQFSKTEWLDTADNNYHYSQHFFLFDVAELEMSNLTFNQATPKAKLRLPSSQLKTETVQSVPCLLYTSDAADE